MARPWLVGALLLLLWGLWSPQPAHAAEVGVVLVKTEGSRAWSAAERRLVAELRTLHIRLVLLTGRTDADRQLARYVREYDAVAGIQALRDGERGVIRFWLAPGEQPGGYAHANIDLRGADVLERAVAPVFQRVFGRVMEAASSGGAPRGEEGAELIGAAPPDRPRRSSLSRPYGLALAAGPWFFARFTDPSVAYGLRLRADWLPFLSLQGDALLAQGPDTGESGSRLIGSRAMALLNPWPRARVRAAVGAGLGAAWAADGAQVTNVLGRIELRAPVRADIGLVLALTGGAAIGNRPPVWKDSSTSFDMLVGVEWQWGAPIGPL